MFTFLTNCVTLSVTVITMKDNKNLYIGAYILNKCARTRKHIRQIKKANIDFMVSIDYNDKNTLDLFEKYSLGAIVNSVFPSWWGSDGENSGQMSDVNPIEAYKKSIANYQPHNAVWGIDIGDEISAKDFKHINTVYEAHKNFFEDKIMYTNLYPNYGVNFNSAQTERQKQWGCNTYKDYIEKYCKEVSLPYICFDHYPYCHNNILMFIENLECVKEAAEKYCKSVYVVAQSSSYSKDVFITRSLLRKQIYIALGFNVKVIMWACYSAGWWYNHILDENGNKTKLYKDIKAVNTEAKKFFKEISQYKCHNSHILNSNTRISTEFSVAESIETKDDNLFLVCEAQSLQSEKMNAVYIVNISENESDGKIILKCKNKLKVFTMDKNCKLKYNKKSGIYTLNLTQGYGAVIKSILPE